MQPILLKLSLASALLLGAISTQAEDVILFIQPLENAQMIGRADSANPAIARASEVLDISAAAKGWKWAELSLTTEGYVPTSSLNKNYDVSPGTFVRNKANSGAIILTTAQAEDRFEVLSSTSDWTQVRFNKPIPVYFKTDGVSADTIVATTSAPATVQAPLISTPSGATSSVDISNFDPNASVGTTRPSSLAPENVQWRSGSTPVSAPVRESSAPTQTDLIPQAPSEQTPVVVPVEYAAAAETPLAPEIEVGTPTRTLSGKLVRKISNFGPRYPLRLKGSNGKRVAYVDISNVFVSDLRPYLDQRVFVSGEVRPVVPGSQDLVIHARLLRLAD